MQSLSTFLDPPQAAPRLPSSPPPSPPRKQSLAPPTFSKLPRAAGGSVKTKLTQPAKQAVLFFLAAARNKSPVEIWKVEPTLRNRPGQQLPSQRLDLLC